MPIEHIVENVVAVAKRLSQKLPEVQSRRRLAVSPSYKRSKTRKGNVALLSVSEVGEREALVRED